MALTQSYVHRQEFTKIVNGLTDALDFTRTIGVATPASYEKGGGRGVLGEVDFYSRYAPPPLMFYRLLV